MVTLAAVEPRSFTRIREIRSWLAHRGVSRVTFAVTPAPDLHPVGTRAPGFTAWLRGQVARGDAVAQHGLQAASGRAEFRRLDGADADRRVSAGLALLREVELDPRGFIAPAYGYTPELRRVLAGRFDWYAERRRVTGRDAEGAPALLHAPAHMIGPAAGPLWSMPALPGISPARASLLRVDLRAGSFDRREGVRALELLLHRAGERTALSLDDLFAARR
ncbi:MAG TPA: DUF2334 domain-containing protein [Solirubrobacteraceae bacterium]|nr:DUF2334 domain-containing protein [Solirubrobacteraceae bacterium]